MKGSSHTLVTAISTVLLLPALAGVLVPCTMSMCPLEQAVGLSSANGHDCCPEPGAALEPACCLDSASTLAPQAIALEQPRPFAVAISHVAAPPGLAESGRWLAPQPLVLRPLDGLSQSCVLRI